MVTILILKVHQLIQETRLNSWIQLLILVVAFLYKLIIAFTIISGISFSLPIQ